MIFPIEKRANKERKSCLMYYRLDIVSFFNYEQASPLLNTIWCSLIWLRTRYTNKSDKIRTCDSMRRLASLNSIPPTWWSFLLFWGKLKFPCCYTNYSIQHVLGPAAKFHFWIVAIHHKHSAESLFILWKSNWHLIFLKNKHLSSLR